MSDETPIYQGRDADGRFSAGDKPPPPPPPSEEGAVASGYQPPKLPSTCDNQCVGRIRSLQKQYGVRPDQAHDMYEREKQRRQRAERDAEESEEKHLRALEAQEKELAEAEKTLSAQGAADVAKEILLPQDKLDWALLLGGMVTKIPKGGKTLYKIANKGKALEEIRKKRQALNAEIKAGRAKKGAVVEKKAAEKYRRNMAERRKALLRDAKDPNSGLTKEQREFILKHDGNRVPDGLEVSHERPLYTASTNEGKAALDVADNMKTMPKSEHRARHKTCGDQYHYYSR